MGAFVMADRKGFEPSKGDKPLTPLAGERLQPLGHLSSLELIFLRKNKLNVNSYL